MSRAQPDCVITPTHYGMMVNGNWVRCPTFNLMCCMSKIAPTPPSQASESNLDGLPVTYDREFVFAKNRFLATREVLTFEESFQFASRRCGTRVIWVRRWAHTGRTPLWEGWSPATAASR